jgi:hypothetical protein
MEPEHGAANLNQLDVLSENYAFRLTPREEEQRRPQSAEKPGNSV